MEAYCPLRAQPFYKNFVAALFKPELNKSLSVTYSKLPENTSVPFIHILAGVGISCGNAKNILFFTAINTAYTIYVLVPIILEIGLRCIISVKSQKLLGNESSPVFLKYLLRSKWHFVKRNHFTFQLEARFQPLIPKLTCRFAFNKPSI
jgi:hypothetical protein